MVVLGIDPGYAIVGYGAINYENNSFTPISFAWFLQKKGRVFGKSKQKPNRTKTRNAKINFFIKKSSLKKMISKMLHFIQKVYP